MKRLLGLLILLLILGACGGAGPEVDEGVPLGLELTSSAFGEGEAIPARYTCDGEDISPALSWSEPPAETESLVLIMDDPDAPVGTWDHWVVFDLPPGTRSLPEAVPPGQAVAGGGVQGRNSWKDAAYGGPCPPRGSEHRYIFALYALDARLDLDANADKGDVEKAMADHILARGQLTGRYGR
jgi:Raf kinase inhibitor-like YbhB/YbcL family protein